MTAPAFVRGETPAGGTAPDAAPPPKRRRRPSARRRPLARLRGWLAARWDGLKRAVAPGTTWVRRTIGPYAAMVSVLGWVVGLGAIVVSVLGWTRGWVEFRSLGLFGLALIVAAVLFTLGRWEYSAAIELGNARVRIGELALGRVAVRNAASRAAASTTVELPVGRSVAAFTVPRLAPDAEHEEVFQVPARRRSVIRIGPVRSVRSDPLVLIQRQRSWTDVVELFVHPDTVLLDTHAIGFLKDVEGVATQNLSSSDVSFHALRDYVPGDDRRAIHWRTTARVGKLMVRQFEETMRSHLLLLLSLNAADYATPDDFELAVSVLGSMGQAAIREEREISVFTSDGLLEFPSAMGLLDQLCRLELRPSGPSLRELGASAARRVPSASVVAIVAGSNVEPGSLRGAQLVLPAEAATFALRCGAGLTSARRKAATLLVLDVPTLPDLQRALRTLT